MKAKLKIALIALSVVMVAILMVGYFRYLELKNSQTYYDELTTALENAERVETLVMRNQSIIILPSEIGMLHNLKVLNVGNNKLQELPPEIGQLENLEELMIENNSLTTLPKELAQLKHLQKINVSDNKLKIFPANLPTRLEEIYISNNKISNISGEIKTMNHLKVLDLADNEIEEIRPEIRFPQSIVKIDLYHNRIVKTTPTLFSLPNLRELILEDNPLDENTLARYNEYKRH